MEGGLHGKQRASSDWACLKLHPGNGCTSCSVYFKDLPWLVIITVFNVLVHLNIDPGKPKPGIRPGMPKSFLIKRRNSAQLRRRNWGELSDQLRGDLYVPETCVAQALVNPAVLSISSQSKWDGGDPHRLPQSPLYSQSPAAEKPPLCNQGRGLPTQADFQCSVCSKRFPLQRMLNRHRKSHSPVKKHRCSYCSKGFNDTFDLKRHLRTHTGIRPYRCCLCDDKGFTQRCSLESHLRKIHRLPQIYGYRERRTKLFVCEGCGFTCSTSDEYHRHTCQEPSAPAYLGDDFPKPGAAGFRAQLHLLLS